MSEQKGRKTESGAKVLRALSALKGHSLQGLSNGDLAKALGESPSTINRVINTAIAEGWAVRLDSGRFALSIRVLQLAQAHVTELQQAQGRIDELKQRVAAGAH